MKKKETPAMDNDAQFEKDVEELYNRIKEILDKMPKELLDAMNKDLMAADEFMKEYDEPKPSRSKIRLCRQDLGPLAGLFSDEGLYDLQDENDSRYDGYLLLRAHVLLPEGFEMPKKIVSKDQ